MSDRTSQDSTSTNDLWASWIKSTTEFWGAMASAWPTAQVPDDRQTAGSLGRLQQLLSSNLKLWDATAKSMQAPGSMEALLKGLQTAPDISMHFFQTSLNGLFELQKRWVGQLHKIGKSTKPYDFEELDHEFLNRWTDIYKEEIQQFLNIPQLGLTKFYQEKLNRTVDRFNLYQAAMAEFMQLLTVPVEKSMRVMQDKLTEMAESGELPEDSKYYYQLWIKVLEGHFMTLFQSTEYTQTMAKTMDAMNQFLAARQEVLEDMLQALPVTTHKDMDALYQEVYQLKRRIRALEKQLADDAVG
jgi:class III poly(R)-hydroxyalkanoic acid synthase PhaE subunit